MQSSTRSPLKLIAVVLAVLVITALVSIFFIPVKGAKSVRVFSFDTDFSMSIQDYPFVTVVNNNDGSVYTPGPRPWWTVVEFQSCQAMYEKKQYHPVPSSVVYGVEVIKICYEPHDGEGYSNYATYSYAGLIEGHRTMEGLQKAIYTYVTGDREVLGEYSPVISYVIDPSGAIRYASYNEHVQNLLRKLYYHLDMGIPTTAVEHWSEGGNLNRIRVTGFNAQRALDELYEELSDRDLHEAIRQELRRVRQDSKDAITWIRATGIQNVITKPL